MNFSEARERGYVFAVTHERIVFRTPYGQPDSYSTEVTDVPVEVVHASVFSRQSWVVLMVDLVAACSMYEASHDGGYMTWETPEALYPSLGGSQISVGLNADLMEQAAAEQRGFIMEKRNTTIHIGIPYNAEGGYRKSFVKGAIFEFYVFHLYFKQVLVDEDYKETVIRCHRLVVTPLLPCELLTENRTILEEGVFTIYLGQIPDDVDLTSVQLNGNDFTVPFSNERIILTEASEPNNTHSYTLKVSFDDPVVIQEFSREHGAMLHKLAVDYMLTVPGNEPYYHAASFVALQNVSPPVFESNCTSSGISFKLGFRPFDYLWQFSIGSDLLTSALAAERGYLMTNDSQSLLLDVPLFTHGYEYRDVTLMGFLGTFEILVRDGETSEVQASSVKTCPFTSREFIMCSTDGRMTVVADLSTIIPSGQIPAAFHLRNDHCRPKEVSGTRVLFSFPVNSCGAIVKLVKENVTYQNKIFYSSAINVAAYNDTEGVTVQCTYPLAGLNRLFSVYTFDSDTEGFGRIIRTVQPTAGPSPTESTTEPQTTAATQKTRMPSVYMPAYYPTARYIKVSKFPFAGASRKVRSCVFSVKLEVTRQRPELTVLPNVSSRTLLHPSFMSLFMDESFTGRFPHRENAQTVHPLTPPEVYYSDPIVGCRRIPNKLTGMRCIHEVLIDHKLQGELEH
ncbi:uncharacterized protein FYW49_012810 [Xenentodon cancila]